MVVMCSLRRRTDTCGGMDSSHAFVKAEDVDCFYARGTINPAEVVINGFVRHPVSAAPTDVAAAHVEPFEPCWTNT